MAAAVQLYSEREDWADVKPQAQYENLNPIAPILYTDEYKDATDYFRGIVKAGEKSQRVLELTEHIIRQNPAHYTAWQYRYQTLLALNSPLDVELRLMDGIAIQHLKTYQVWHHRRLLLILLRDPVPELSFVGNLLKEEDEKNYHTWSYRQWILSHFQDRDEVWEGELGFVEEMLRRDVRNNSAWHHRFFVVFQSGVRKGEEDREAVIRRETLYTKEQIALAPNNASAWNYLRGILDYNKLPYSSLVEFVKPYAGLAAFSSDDSGTVDLENPQPASGVRLPSVGAIEFIADVYEAEGGEQIERARELWTLLANEHDTMRKNYWEYRIRTPSQGSHPA